VREEEGGGEGGRGERSEGGAGVRERERGKEGEPMLN